MMRFASLGSGSRGNALVVTHEECTILVDCGLSLKTIRSRLADLGLTLDNLNAVFITHEHSDHINGLATLVRNTDVDVFMTEGTSYAAGWHENPRVQFLSDRIQINYGAFHIDPVIVPHDAREPCQFVISGLGRTNLSRLGVLTDLGSVSDHVVEAYRHCDALVLECNHDTDLLWQGAYPHSLKARVSSDWGHLNNLQAADLLDKVGTGRLQQLVLAHISEQNNLVDLACDAIHQVFDRQQSVTVATQSGGFDWLYLE